MEIENTVASGWAAVTGANYTDDATLYRALTGEIIPQSTKLINTAKGVVPGETDLQAIHNVYIRAVETQHQAFLIIKAAIQTQNIERMSSGYATLDESKDIMEEYTGRLNFYAEENNVKIGN